MKTLFIFSISTPSSLTPDINYIYSFFCINLEVAKNVLLAILKRKESILKHREVKRVCINPAIKELNSKSS